MAVPQSPAEEAIAGLRYQAEECKSMIVNMAHSREKKNVIRKKSDSPSKKKPQGKLLDMDDDEEEDLSTLPFTA